MQHVHIDHEGKFYKFGLDTLEQSHPTKEGYIAAQTFMKLAEELKNSKLVIEGDAQDVILALR